MRVWNYPGAVGSDGGMPVRASVTGTVDGRRVRLSWTMPQHGRFSVELFGAGGVPMGRALPNPTKYDLPLVFRVMDDELTLPMWVPREGR